MHALFRTAKARRISSSALLTADAADAALAVVEEAEAVVEPEAVLLGVELSASALVASNKACNSERSGEISVSLIGLGCVSTCPANRCNCSDKR